MAYTEAEKEQFLREIFDSNKKVTLVCGQHNFAGTGMPNLRCPDCWKVYYINMIAQTPPHLRAEKISELSEVVHHMVEEAASGKFDFTPLASPIIKITKED